MALIYQNLSKEDKERYLMNISTDLVDVSAKDLMDLYTLLQKVKILDKYRGSLSGFTKSCQSFFGQDNYFPERYWSS